MRQYNRVSITGRVCITGRVSITGVSITDVSIAGVRTLIESPVIPRVIPGEVNIYRFSLHSKEPYLVGGEKKIRSDSERF